MSSIKNTNDGKAGEPYLRMDLNYGNVDGLPDFSQGPHNATDFEKHRAIKDAGFTGVQGGDPEICAKLGLRMTGDHRVSKVGDLDEKILEWTSGPYDCGTIHLGWGIEPDPEVDRLTGYVLELSARHDFPVYIETHRATVTQDIWRTVELTRRFPSVRFNGDFSHWYTGLEMVNGSMEEKLDFMMPVFERVRFLHGRIGTPGCIQVDIGDGRDLLYVDHFKEMWKRSFAGFLKTAQPGDYICFTPELLSSTYYYAQLVSNAHGEKEETGDRWTQALLYCDIAKACWEEAGKAALSCSG